MFFRHNYNGLSLVVLKSYLSLPHIYRHLFRRGTLRFFVLIALVFSAALTLPSSALAERFLSDADAKLMRSALKAAGKKQWKTVRYRENRLENPLAKKFLLWHRLAGDGYTPKFHEADQFTSENPGWPRKYVELLPRNLNYTPVWRQIPSKNE